MKITHDKEEYRKAYAIKQKVKGLSYRTTAKDIGVNYRNVYDWLDNYRKYGLDGIRNRRKNGGRKPVISTEKNKQMIKDIVLNKSPRTFDYLKKYMEYQATGRIISFFTPRNQCQSHANMEDNS